MLRSFLVGEELGLVEGLFVDTGVGLGVGSKAFMVGCGVGTLVVGRREGRCVGDFVFDITWLGLGVGEVVIGFKVGLRVGTSAVGFGVII